MKFDLQMPTDILRFSKLLLLAFLIHLTSNIEIDNGLAGDPEVECGANSVEMQFRTKNPFRGKVFVKGHFSNPSCKVDYSSYSGIDKPRGGIVIHHGDCDMDRQRIINPQGMEYSSVVVVSFHSTFITKVDRAFHIKCMYRELDKTVGSKLEVSMLTTQVIDHDVPMPVCTYTIRKDEIDGEILRYARVGEQVVHRWECQSEVYGILVHSCYVEDGHGEKVEVIDERGCHMDRYLLGDPTYVEDLNLAYRESHVFKFADRVSVRFNCQIRLCMKEDDGCRGITPPSCPENRKLLSEAMLISDDTHGSSDARFLGRRFLNHNREKRETRGVKGLDFSPVDGDFSSQFIYVLDSTEDPEIDTEENQQSIALSRFLERANGAIVTEVRNSICLSSATFTILLVSVTVVFVAATFVAVSLCCQKLKFRKIRPVDMENFSSPTSCYNNFVAFWNSD